MREQPIVLLVDDDAAVLRGVGGLLRDEGYEVTTAASAREAQVALRDPARGSPALMILDIRMPGETGLDLLAQLPQPLPFPVVILSGEATMSDTLQALKKGAADFVEKPASPERLLTAVRNALMLRSLAEDRERLLQELGAPGHLVGTSAAMEELRRIVARVGPSAAAVLIAGETGTGKERVARALHGASGRKGRFIAVNCAAIPRDLLESELFGHERGAFSGANERRIGRIEQALGGTLLLDEIGDMPLELQPKLLRVLEAREIERLGGASTVPIDVRFLASTHRDLPQLIKDGRFREDLFYRLNVFPLRIPPLRDRPEDVLPLLQTFAADFVRPGEVLCVAPGALDALGGYGWPGNVRELRNYVERLSLLRPDGDFVIDRSSVASLLGGATVAPPEAACGPLTAMGGKSYREIIEDLERGVLRDALARSSGNIAAAARLLRSDRGHIYRRMRTLGVLSDDTPEE
jgi:two-component system, NtrC family, nitrogen regulation response regulator NtrX